MTDLALIPEPPEGLRESALRGNLVLFIGAGASRLAGCPGWDEFANGALQQLIEKGQLTYSQFEQIRGLSPRIKLSIARNIGIDTSTTISYDDLLPTPKQPHAKGKRLYASLFKLGRIFVTTNYDRWLDERIIEATITATPADTARTPTPNKMRVIHKVNDFLPAALMQPNTVIHLHGSVIDPVGMVLTTRHYVERYANDHRTGDPSTENPTLTFLEDLFANYTVLFIGYGLEELELLEYVILKAREQRRDENEIRHYLVQGFFSHEQTVCRSMKQYYRRECGIQLVPFLRDQKNHDQLIDVLEHFSKQMPAKEALLLERGQQLENLAGEMEFLDE